MILVKNWPFFHLFFSGNIGQENVFYDSLEGVSSAVAMHSSVLKCYYSNFSDPEIMGFVN